MLSVPLSLCLDAADLLITDGYVGLQDFNSGSISHKKSMIRTRILKSRSLSNTTIGVLSFLTS